MFRKAMNKKGFTLIELIVVIAIIGILAALGAPKFMGHIANTKVAAMQNDAKILENAVMQYAIAHEVDGESEALPIKDSAVPLELKFDDFDGVTGVEKTVSITELDGALLKNFLKKTKNPLASYGVATKGEFEGQVFSIENFKNGEKVEFNGLYQVTDAK